MVHMLRARKDGDVLYAYCKHCLLDGQKVDFKMGLLAQIYAIKINIFVYLCLNKWFPGVQLIFLIFS